MTRAFALAAAAILIGLVGAAAQPPVLEARATGVSGRVMLSSAAGGAALALTRGSELAPGDRIDTRGGGRAVISLNDGSVFIVEPESVLVLKDYRAAGSARELFEITLGRVRVRINHLGGRPNPYRINSPTAAIAVRGTEFTVAVDAQGATRVDVLEGTVEVASLSDPAHTVLLEAGHSVLVAPGREFRLLSPAAARFSDNEQHEAVHGSLRSAGTPSQEDVDPPSPRTSAGTYNRYMAGLSDIEQGPFLLRFNAFAEPHLDSLENPAYAASFQSAEGRLFVLPSFSGSQALMESGVEFGATLQPADYSFTPQISLFVPAGSRVVAGGSFALSRIGSGDQTLAPDLDLGQSEGFLSTTGSARSTFYAGSALAAVRLGHGSAGVAFEALRGSGSLVSTTWDPETFEHNSVENIASRSHIRQSRITLGLARRFAEGHTVGGFARYGSIDATDGESSHLLDGVPAGLSSTASRGHSWELGFRLRGPVSRRLFYGVEASWLRLSLGDTLVRPGASDSHQHGRAARGSAGFGLGYALGGRALVALDIAGGASAARASRYENATGGLLQNGSADGRFLSAHAAVQAGVWRRLFVTASLLALWQSHGASYVLYPDSLGRASAVADSFLPTVPVRPVSVRYSDFGAGWRFSPDLFLEYVYSTSYGHAPASHALLLRYTFALRHR